MTWIAQTKKAIGAFLVGAVGWGAAVVESAPAHITATEWIAGATVIVSTLVVYVLTNAPADA
jgi:hypothetical protein